METEVLRKFDAAVEAKQSILCLGLDPDPSTYVSREDKLGFCLKIIKTVAENVSAVKVNENFVRDLSVEDHVHITSLARENGLLTVYDCKMGDIENTNRAGLQLVKRMGYDLVTFNPVLGNLQDAVRDAAGFGVGVLALLHPSNPASRKYYRAVLEDGRRLYELFLEDVCASGAEGVVLGLHPELAPEEIASIRARLGEEKIILFPGFGVQGGDPRTAVKHGGRRILVNVGRTILSSPNPKQTAAELSKQLNELRRIFPVE
ncbi:MAG: orotidine 5'-phosphate decarboxylase [Candidatus Caldarchaeum sp.]